jgi:hypothetical protein
MDKNNRPSEKVIVLVVLVAAVVPAACGGTELTRASGNSTILSSPPTASPVVLDRLTAKIRAAGADFYSHPQIENGLVAEVIDGQSADVNGHLDGGQPVVLEARTSDGLWFEGAVSGGEYGGYGGWFRAEDLWIDETQDLLSGGSKLQPVPSPQMLLAVVPVTPRPTLTPAPTYSPAKATAAADEATRAPIETQVAAYIASNNVSLPADPSLGEATQRAMVDATRCAVAPPPTPAPLPFQIAVTPLAGTAPQALCTGSGVWLDGRWQAGATKLVDGFTLAELHNAYAHYLDFISFRNGPPSTDLADQLARYMPRQQHLDYLLGGESFGTQLSSESRLYVEGEIRILLAQGYYIRMTEINQIQWDERHNYLKALVIHKTLETTRVAPQIGWLVDLAWSSNMRRELVDTRTNRVIKTCRQQRVGGEPVFLYDPDQARWILIGDVDGGPYGQNVISPFGVRDYGFGQCD